jgi:diguanylate cyclase (GGDEF)-like protein
MRKKIVPEHMLLSKAFMHARNYTTFRRGKRLGRGAITDPKAFNQAETMALRVARTAQQNFTSPEFQKTFGRASPEVQRLVKMYYQRLLRYAATMRLMARRDRLHHSQTPQVLNRRFFRSRVRELLQKPDGKPFAVAMLDLDHFGQLNKKYNHKVGDFVLDRFASELSSFCRQQGGFAGRVGGEEFQLYLPMSAGRAAVLLQKFNTQFKELSGAVAFTSKLKELYSSFDERTWGAVSFSGGVAGREKHNNPENPESIYAVVDTGLKRAKESGRSSVVRVSIPENLPVPPKRK